MRLPLDPLLVHNAIGGLVQLNVAVLEATTLGFENQSKQLDAANRALVALKQDTEKLAKLASLARELVDTFDRIDPKRFEVFGSEGLELLDIAAEFRKL